MNLKQVHGFSSLRDPLFLTQSRQRLHESIILKALKGARPNNENCKPFYLATWGGANSAKSVVVEILRQLGVIPSGFAYLGMHLFEEVPEFQRIQDESQHPHPEKAPELIEEYYFLIEKIIRMAKELNISVIFDDHGDQIDEYSKHIEIVKTNNSDSSPYETILWGQAIEPNFFMWYMEKKFNEGTAKPEWIPYAIQLFQKLSVTFPSLINKFDYSFLNESHIRLKEFPLLIASWGKDNSRSFNQKLYNETVLAWLGANPLVTLCQTGRGLWGAAHSGSAYGALRRGDVYEPATCQTSFTVPQDSSLLIACNFLESIHTRMLLYYSLYQGHNKN